MSVTATVAADRPVAVFDLDGTLVRSDTFLPFLISYARRRRRLCPLIRLPIQLGLYASRIWPDHVAKERVLISFLRGAARDEVAEHARWFCEHWVAARLNPPVLERLEEHQRKGRRVVLLSASPDVYVAEVARKLGIAEVLCTEVRGDETRWDGRLLGVNCKGQAKVDRLKRYLGVQEFPAESWAYGDSRSDLPLLHAVRQGFLVKRKALIPVSQLKG